MSKKAYCLKRSWRTLLSLFSLVYLTLDFVITLKRTTATIYVPGALGPGGKGVPAVPKDHDVSQQLPLC